MPLHIIPCFGPKMVYANQFCWAFLFFSQEFSFQCYKGRKNFTPASLLPTSFLIIRLNLLPHIIPRLCSSNGRAKLPSKHHFQGDAAPVAQSAAHSAQLNCFNNSAATTMLYFPFSHCSTHATYIYIYIYIYMHTHICILNKAKFFPSAWEHGPDFKT